MSKGIVNYIWSGRQAIPVKGLFEFHVKNAIQRLRKKEVLYRVGLSQSLLALPDVFFQCVSIQGSLNGDIQFPIPKGFQYVRKRSRLLSAFKHLIICASR